MNNYKKVEIYLREDTIEKINDIKEYVNYRNKIKKQTDEKFTSEDFIIGSTYHYLNQIEFGFKISGLDEFGESYKLQNRFKELAEERFIDQKTMSNLTMIDPANISYIWRNRNQPSLEYFLRIWIVLGCPPIEKCLFREKAEN
jgi:hypothetical protein